jgi:hypothetical protein
MNKNEGLVKESKFEIISFWLIGFPLCLVGQLLVILVAFTSLTNNSFAYALCNLFIVITNPILMPIVIVSLIILPILKILEYKFGGKSK